jgi:leucyl-tRNA synthetase
MSKSKGNGVSPEVAIAKYGADTLRMFTLFKAPPEKDLEWEDADVEGQQRFLNRVWRLVTQSILWQAIRNVDYDNRILEPWCEINNEQWFPDQFKGAATKLLKKDVAIDSISFDHIENWCSEIIEKERKIRDEYYRLTEDSSEQENSQQLQLKICFLLFFPLVTQEEWQVFIAQDENRFNNILQGKKLDVRFVLKEERTNVALARFTETTEFFDKAERELLRSIHTAIKDITEDMEGGYQLNTAISEMMKLSNAISGSLSIKISNTYHDGINTLLNLLAPFAPHIAEELWSLIGHTDSIHLQPWLTHDPDALTVDEITLVIQINGKVRGSLQVPSSASNDKQALEEYARSSSAAQKYLEGKEIKKVIAVPGKLVNFVVV